MTVGFFFLHTDDRSMNLRTSDKRVGISLCPPSIIWEEIYILGN